MPTFELTFSSDHVSFYLLYEFVVRMYLQIGELNAKCHVFGHFN